MIKENGFSIYAQLTNINTKTGGIPAEILLFPIAIGYIGFIFYFLSKS
ncbi:hypothetical protein FACS189459_1740 [Bacilli bacterium]|nr:hypothetical protein FACS189459_1740 [Bacilli bacterium]